MTLIFGIQGPTFALLASELGQSTFADDGAPTLLAEPISKLVLHQTLPLACAIGGPVAQQWDEVSRQW
jgi:hypothetical protein